ncbi:PREDICTED: protein phosphatase 1 regulatory subunit 26 [Chrysochloris asiatica]|uniref:Protein phosphatase 1 regulatory subunit 26 n=1 Tax=Chrysochloris asiatica TaxID=185453 RepID=A0A9B0WQ76_CHRAS|nr:PREDICTED: protein phosphatase 1 regulatory subunit 26 [Chrysochloris asiatica]
MFLMNVPPVVALQSKWEAFGPSGSCRFPGCFSEDTEGVARAAVSTKVQMVISTLRKDGATLGMSDEHAAHRSHRGEPYRNARLTGNPAVPTTCTLATDFNSREQGAAVDFGPLVLDSDSDDSVDRDIEEAIQEYLKAKSGSVQPVSGGARPTVAAETSSQCKLDPLHSNATTALCPTAKPGAVPTVAGGVSGSPPGAGDNRGPPSPVSVSSDDSFEQSIRAEIEQFLNEKKQHKIPKGNVPVVKKPEPGEVPARPLCRSSKEPLVRAHRQDALGAGKEFVFRKQKPAVQPRGPKGKVTAEAEAGPKVAACRPLDTTQNKGGTKRSAGAGKRGKRAKSAALVPTASDSSSDDGIEEAIQQYQLEKSRKETSGDTPLRAPPRDEKGPAPPANSTCASTKPVLSETLRKTPSRKKPATTKAAEVSPVALDSSRPPKGTKTTPPTGCTATKGEHVDQTPCRADTSAELMCAEAILDISKTILPVPRTSSLLYTPGGPSRSDGDGSSVDSDDSIEQEIRTFLALKAQSGSLLARAESCPPPAWSPRSSPGPNGPVSGPKALLSKPQDAPLNCKRKRRGGASTSAKPLVLKRSKEVMKDSPEAEHTLDGRDVPSPGKASEAPAREVASETGNQPLPSKTAELELINPDVRGGTWLGYSQANEARGVEEKGSSEDHDKSSSLDSDEDLDTAIKDLLRSKRRFKRRSREPRVPAGKKRVRFSTTETQCLETLGDRQKHWTDRSPCLLKSCLLKPKKDSREATTRRLGCVAEMAPVDSCGDVPAAFEPRNQVPEGSLFSNTREVQKKETEVSVSDDSSSVDSDDSIELEIRKFLAEKAKESVNCVGSHASGPLTLGPEGLPRPETLGRKELAPALCTWSQRSREATLLAEEPKSAERATGAPSSARFFSQGAKGLPTAPGRCEPAPPKSASVTFSAKGSPAGRRTASTSRDVNPRGTEPEAAERAFGQLPSGAKASLEAESTSAFQMNHQSLSSLTPGPGEDRENRVLLCGRPQAALVSPWTDFTQQGRPQSPWPLHPAAAWKGGLGAERDCGTEGPTKCSPGPALDPKKSLPFAGFSPLLSTQLFHFGKSVSWGSKQASLFSSHLGLPLQGPSFSTFRGVPLGPSPMFGSSHLLVKKEGGQWLSRKTPDRRTSGSEENILDLRYRRRPMQRDEDDQEMLGSDVSELSDTSVEDGAGGGVKGSILQL